jgi:hypothetical protein
MSLSHTHLPPRAAGHEVVRARTVLRAMSHARGLSALQVLPYHRFTPRRAPGRYVGAPCNGYGSMRSVVATLLEGCALGGCQHCPISYGMPRLQGATHAARRSGCASSRTKRGLHVTCANEREKDGAVPTQSLPAKAKASFTDANFPMDPEVHAHTSETLTHVWSCVPVQLLWTLETPDPPSGDSPVAHAAETYPTARLTGWTVASQGRVYHLGVKRGEVANRILSVGDTSRARLLSGEEAAESSGVSSSHPYTHRQVLVRVPLSQVALPLPSAASRCVCRSGRGEARPMSTESERMTEGVGLARTERALSRRARPLEALGSAQGVSNTSADTYAGPFLRGFLWAA